MEENGTQPAMRSALQPLRVENIDTESKSNRERAAEVDYAPDYERPPSRRPADEREESFSVTGWIFQGVAGLIEEVQHHDLGMPEEFWIHAYAAQREGKMALDIALDEIRKRVNTSSQKNIEREQRQERRGGIAIDF